MANITNNEVRRRLQVFAKEHANNKAVDKAYGYKGADDDASRVAFLFKLYEQLTSLLPSQPIKKTKAKHKGLPNG